MSKWIAEFELEDGDTMPEHMDLEYKGVRIDFHCKPLEQEPVIDKIRAEIENDWQLKKYPSSPFSCGLRRAIEIIDEYKGESEDNK